MVLDDAGLNIAGYGDWSMAVVQDASPAPLPRFSLPHDLTSFDGRVRPLFASFSSRPLLLSAASLLHSHHVCRVLSCDGGGTAF